MNNYHIKLARLKQGIKDKKNILIINTLDDEIINIILSKLDNHALDNIEIWHKFSHIAGDEHLVCVPEDEMTDVIGLYGLYEFSDKVSVISESTQYGSLYNYVKIGLLTKEEMVDALLYEI